MATPDATVSLRAVGRSALILVGGSAAVQVVGVARELFVVAQVGLSRELDAFLIALALPLTLSGLLTSGTITALVPAYLETRTERGLAEARRLAGAVISWVAIAALILVVALAVLAGGAVRLAGPGLDAASRQHATAYLQLMAPAAFFAAVSAILTSICQAEERFVAIALAMLAGPLVTLTILLSFWGPLHLGAYALGSLAGAMVTATVLLVATVRASVAPLPAIWTRGLGRFVRHAWPLTLSAAILQLNVVADRAIASLLAPGAVSALRYGEILVRTPISAIAPAWSVAMYPAQVRAVNAAAGPGIGAATSRSIAYALSAFIPLAVLAAALAPLAVHVAYARGAFGAADVAVTANVVAAFSPLIPILMVSPVLAGAHNARRRGFVLLATGTMNVVMNFAFDVVLGTWLGVAGVALSSSVTSTILTIFLARRLAASEPDFELRPLALTAVRSLGAIAAPAGLVALVAWSGIGRGPVLMSLALLVGLGLAALIVYAEVAARTGSVEVRSALGIIGNRLRRPRRGCGLR